MEFTRRKRRKQTFRSSRPTRPSRAGGGHAGGSAGAGRAIVALLMVAAIVYLISASAAGTWLAEHVMAPAFDALAARTKDKQEDIQDPPQEDVQQVSLSTAESSVSANIALPALDCYALQMGVFSSSENAAKQAEALQGQGAGGYVLQDGDRYRVLAAGYAQEAEAKEVKNRLVDEGMDCTVYQLSAPGATFRVSAEESQLAEVETGFSALYEAQATLTEAAIAFDRDAQSVTDGQMAAQGIQTQLEQRMAGLAAYADSAPAIASLIACRDQFCAALSGLVQSAAPNHAAFSAQIKHAQLSVTKAYADMVAGLT